MQLLIPFSVGSIADVCSLLRDVCSSVGPIEATRAAAFLPVRKGVPRVTGKLSRTVMREARSVSVLDMV